MKKSILIFAVAVSLTGCAGMQKQNDGWAKYRQNMRNNLSTMEILIKDQETLAKQENSHAKMLGNIKNASEVAIDQERQCEFSRRTREHALCMDVLRSVNASGANIELIAADYFAKTGDKEKARQLYRAVTVSYAAEAYRSYVKKAEYGLEDLKR